MIAQQQRRVKRSSTLTIFQLTDINWQAAWDFTDTGTISNDGSGNIEQINDITGNGYHLTQTTPADRITNATVDGNNVGRITAINQFLDRSDSCGITGVTDVTIYYVIDLKTVSNPNPILITLGNPASGANRILPSDRGDISDLVLFTGSTVSFGSPKHMDVGLACFDIFVDASDLRNVIMRENNIARNTTSINQSLSLTSVQTGINTFQRISSIDYMFVGIKTGDLTSQERSDLQQYFGNLFTAIPSS